MPAAISGHVFLDPTGNGAAAGDPGQGGVTVRLFRDSNNNGVLDSGDRQAASTVTRADGSFSFGSLAAGRYFLTEVVPSGYVRTAPTTSSYSFDLTAGQSATGNDFYNFRKLSTSVVTNVSFTVTDGTTTKTVTDLRGQTQQGDTVTVNFTVTGTQPVQVSLVAYNAPGSSFDANTASQQTIFAQSTQTFAPGRHSLTVQLPPNYYQVDFVIGGAITQLGPAGSNIFYSAQGRLVSADNGGTNPVQPPASLSGVVYLDDNANGVQDTGEAGVQGATVTLLNSNGQTVGSTTTDTNGAFNFGNLPPGTYTLVVDAPSFAEQTVTGIVVKPGDNSTGVPEASAPIS